MEKPEQESNLLKLLVNKLVSVKTHNYVDYLNY
jgi:hypothetical protein